MIEKIKDLRKEVDGLAQLTKELKPVYREKGNNGILGPGFRSWGSHTNSKEINKTVNSLYLAKAWLGKLLEELDVPTPYKNDGKRKSVEDIEPTSDVGDAIWKPGQSHVEKVDYLRQHIKRLIGKVVSLKAELYEEYKDVNSDWTHCLVKYWEYLIEARFHLGFELKRLYNDK